jgi:hypothetical protein
MSNVPDTPPLGDMTRKQRMRRLQDNLRSQGLYVWPVCKDKHCTETGYFIVAVDDHLFGQDQG